MRPKRSSSRPQWKASWRIVFYIDSIMIKAGLFPSLSPETSVTPCPVRSLIVFADCPMRTLHASIQVLSVILASVSILSSQNFRECRCCFSTNMYSVFSLLRVFALPSLFHWNVTQFTCWKAIHFPMSSSKAVTFLEPTEIPHLFLLSHHPLFPPSFPPCTL